MDYREAEEIIKKSWNDTNHKDIDYDTFNKALNHLWCCGYREEEYKQAIDILSSPEYLQVIMDKFNSEELSGYAKHEKNVILRRAFEPYWRPEIGIKELIRLRDKYKLDDFELGCLILIDDFIRHIECGGIMSFDGHGKFVIGKRRLPIREFTVKECRKMKIKGCTFVLWYNK